MFDGHYEEKIIKIPRITSQVNHLSCESREKRKSPQWQISTPYQSLQLIKTIQSKSEAIIPRQAIHSNIVKLQPCQNATHGSYHHYNIDITNNNKIWPGQCR